MNAKLLIAFCSFALLSGCCSNGCTAWDGCGSSGGNCGGCSSSYWSTSCPTPNTGGASEAAFTDIADPCSSEGCAHNYYSGCNGGCNSSMNW